MEWRDVVGYENLYQISEYGDIRYKNNPTRMRKFIEDRGYKLIMLRQFGWAKMFHAHTLVYRSFIGLIPDGFVVHHIDENRSNNHFSNLMIMKRGIHASFHNLGKLRKSKSST